LFQKPSGSTPEEYGQSYIDRWGDTDFLVNAKLAAGQILDHTPQNKDIKTMKIMDVGCLNGYIMESLHRSGAQQLYGTDISYFLAVEKNLNPELLTGITIGDFSNNTYPSYAFDMTICMEVLEHIPPSLTSHFVEELARITKKDGILLISTSEDWFVDETHINCRNRAQWYYEFGRHGLVAEGSQVIFPGFNSFVVRHHRGFIENVINRLKTSIQLALKGRLKRPEGR
jgi:SAM-dependent methyltransferase